MYRASCESILMHTISRQKGRQHYIIPYSFTDWWISTMNFCLTGCCSNMRLLYMYMRAP
jgi:hypothetical protein